VSSDGHLWHAIRNSNGGWTPFGDIEGETGDVGLFSQVDIAADGDDLQVAGITTEGHLWHTIRRKGWTGMGDVEQQAGDKGAFKGVSVAS
jgi:hypothetical protein